MPMRSAASRLGKRLVHQENLGLADDGPRNGDALTLPPGQFRRLLLQPRRQLNDLRGLFHLNADVVFLPPLHLERKGDVVEYGHMRIEGVKTETPWPHHACRPGCG